MRNFNSSQLKALSEFTNTVAAAWFSAGIISPLFIGPETFLNILILVLVALMMTGLFLFISLAFLRKIKL